MKTVFSDYSDICAAFLSRKDAKTPITSIMGAEGEGTQGGTLDSRYAGTYRARRLESKDDKLVSYGHYVMAEFIDDSLVVYPPTTESRTTQKQYHELFSLLGSMPGFYRLGAPAIVHNEEKPFVSGEQIWLHPQGYLVVGRFTFPPSQIKRLSRIKNLRGKVFFASGGFEFRVDYVDDALMVAGCSVIDWSRVKDLLNI